MTTTTRPLLPAARTDDDRVLAATPDGLRGPGVGDGLLPGRRITSLATDGDDVWLLVDGNEVHRLGPHGHGVVATLGSTKGTCLHVHRGIVFVGADPATLWRLRGDHLEPVSAFDGAPTSEAWHTPWGGPAAVMSMASAGDDLLVGVHVGGILRSADLGRSWEATIDLHDDVHQVAVDPASGNLWAATGERGLGRSLDRGRTWSYHADGLHATYLLAVAVADRGVLVGASSGHAGADGALYLFDGVRFERIVDGLPERFDGAIGPRMMAASGPLAALALPDGSLRVSVDGGRRWRLADRPGSVTEVALRSATGQRSEVSQ
ncbi:MAG: hypothetical protein ACFCVK_09995 [Acidimicrobiales bacterium]